MENILFVMTSMTSGGAERSLITLLSSLDYNKYNVDLFLFEHEGLFYKSIPEEVNIINKPDQLKKFQKLKFSSIIELLTSYPSVVPWRLMKMIFWIFPAYRKYAYQKNWMFLKHAIPPMQKKYDYAIGYMQTSPVYMIVEKVQAKKKIGFIHTDYQKSDFDTNFDNKYFDKLDRIILVSESSRDSFEKVFPQYSSKLRIVPNIVSKSTCEILAGEENPYALDDSIKILTIGRLVPVKGYDIAIESLKLLISEGYNIKWFVIGKGNQENQLLELVEKLDLTDSFIFLGEKSNPYPYIRYCDIYVQPSRWEGWGIALEEALILNKPVVATNFESALEQIEQGFNGLVSEMSPNSLRDNVKLMIDDIELRTKIIENLFYQNKDKDYNGATDLYKVLNEI